MDEKVLDYRSIMGEPVTRMEVLAEIEKDDILYETFRGFPEHLQEGVDRDVRYLQRSASRG